jgi:NADH dehydrogenase FAD-containing subunit
MTGIPTVRLTRHLGGFWLHGQPRGTSPPLTPPPRALRVLPSPVATTVILLDAAPAVLGSFGDRLGAKALAKLEAIGVQVQLAAKVVGVDGTGIEVEDARGPRRIESVCKVWAAGVSASPLGRQLAEQSGAGLDRAGRIKVYPDLTCRAIPRSSWWAT